MLLYRELAEHYFALERSPSGLELDVSHLEGVLRENGADRVLDVGCGSGEHVAELNRRGFDATGLDRSSGMIETARSRFPTQATRFVVGDWDHFPASVPFDAVLCLFGSLGYRLKDARVLRSLRAFRSALRPGGVAVLELWNAGPLALIAGAVRSQGHRAPTSKAIGGRSPLERTRHLRIVREVPFVVRLDYVYETARGPLRDRHFLRAFRPDELRSLAGAAGFSLERLSDSFDFAGDEPGDRKIRMGALLRAV